MTNLNDSTASSFHGGITMADKNTTGHSTSDIAASGLMDSREVGRLLWVYWSPFTFFFGLIGNALVIKIFGFAKPGGMKQSTTSIYFTVMAIADFSFVICGIVPEWLEACKIVVLKELNFVVCKLEKFLFYTSGDVAIWIICITTMDRFIAVCFPYTQQTFRKTKYAIIASIGTLVVAILKNFHVFWTRGPVYSENGDIVKVCGRPEPFTHFEYYVRPWIAFVLVALLPFLLLVVFNIFIIKFFLKEQRRKRVTGKRHQPDFTQTIVMCIAVSVAFLVFVTPSLILYIGKPYWADNGENYIYDVMKAVANQLSYVNHSINFLLYCITARKFRIEASKLILPRALGKHCIIIAEREEQSEIATNNNWKSSIKRTLSLKRSKPLAVSQNDVIINCSSSENLVKNNKNNIDLKDNSLKESTNKDGELNNIAVISNGHISTSEQDKNDK